MGGGRALAMAGLMLLLVAPPVAVVHAAGPVPVLLAEAKDGAKSVTADEAAEIARAATGGRVLRVDRIGDGHARYRVKLLIDGQRVRHVVIDARSGRIRD